MAEITAMHDKSPSELHDLGLAWLAEAADRGISDAGGARAASTAIGFFFAAMSADNLGTEAGSHRTDEHTPPHGTPAVVRLAGPAEPAGHRG
jgi:hypothetical protein